MRFARSAFCVAVLLLGFSGAATSLRLDSNQNEPAGGHARRGVAASSQLKAANADWADRLRSEDFWQPMRPAQSRADAPRREDGGAGSEARRGSSASHRDEEARSRTGRGRNRDGGTYR